MGENELKRMMSACGEARFHTYICSQACLFPTLNILAGQLQSVIFTFATRDCADLSKSWAGCSNLREAIFYVCDVELIEALMSTPNPHLRILHIGLEDVIVETLSEDEQERRIGKIMDFVSEGTNSVEEFKIMGLTGPKFCGEEQIFFILCLHQTETLAI